VSKEDEGEYYEVFLPPLEFEGARDYLWDQGVILRHHWDTARHVCIRLPLGGILKLVADDTDQFTP